MNIKVRRKTEDERIKFWQEKTRQALAQGKVWQYERDNLVHVLKIVRREKKARGLPMKVEDIINEALKDFED